jgi:hypothetical protein
MVQVREQPPLEPQVQEAPQLLRLIQTGVIPERPSYTLLIWEHVYGSSDILLYLIPNFKISPEQRRMLEEAHGQFECVNTYDEDEELPVGLGFVKRAVETTWVKFQHVHPWDHRKPTLPITDKVITHVYQCGIQL